MQENSCNVGSKAMELGAAPIWRKQQNTSNHIAMKYKAEQCAMCNSCNNCEIQQCATICNKWEVQQLQQMWDSAMCNSLQHLWDTAVAVAPNFAHWASHGHKLLCWPCNAYPPCSQKSCLLLPGGKNIYTNTHEVIHAQRKGWFNLQGVI